MSQLKRFIQASMELIVLKEQIQKLQYCKGFLIRANTPICVAVYIEEELMRKSEKADKLREYIKIRLEYIMVEEPEFDIDSFRFLTRQDIKIGIIALNDEMSLYMILATGKVVKNFVKDVPNPIETLGLNHDLFNR